MLIFVFIIIGLIFYIVLITFQMFFITGTSKTYWEQNIQNKRLPTFVEKWFLNLWYPEKLGWIIGMVGGLLPPLGFIIIMIIFKRKYWRFRDMAVDKLMGDNMNIR